MKKFVTIAIALLVTSFTASADEKVTSPDGKLVVTVAEGQNGSVLYSARFNGVEMLRPSRLGLYTSLGNFVDNLKLKKATATHIADDYQLWQSKRSNIHYEANGLELAYENKDGRTMLVEFQVSNNNVAYRYSLLYKNDDRRTVKISGEASSFRLPDGTTTFICQQAKPMTGWMQTKPSYEEEYKADAAMTERTQTGMGYTFPCLFHEGDNGWVLISETGVGGKYPASHLSEYSQQDGYTVAFPDKAEGNGLGYEGAALSLPAKTPWRTITFGKTLKPIVETTIPFDVVEQQYEPSCQYKGGRYTWSWILWQDNSINYDDQVAFIDVAAKMGYEYCLVDGGWEHNIGRKGIERLSRYAQQKGVNLLLWYNSNGPQNNAPQDARNCMDNIIARKKEMKWMQSIGVKGIKVDFFGSDKQNMMQLYEEILSDANDYGIGVIFHGCTLPRGWERMYPNYIASEAALASENLVFSQYHCDKEGFELTMHPFCRNVAGSFDWGGIILNKRLNRGNDGGSKRRSSDVFEMATGIINQTSMQCVALQPNNIADFEALTNTGKEPAKTQKAIQEFLRQLPTEWQDCQFIDGYPTRYVVLARQTKQGEWIVAGLNGTDKAMILKLHLPMFAGKTLSYFTDKSDRKGDKLPTAIKTTLKVDKNGYAKVTMQGMGGIILSEK